METFLTIVATAAGASLVALITYTILLGKGMSR